MLNKLQIKILLILFVVLSVTISANYYLSNYILRAEFASAVKAENFAIGQGLKLQVERLLSYGLPLNDLVGFDELCIEVAKNNNVDYAAVVDVNGTVLFHSDLKQNRGNIDVPEIIAALKGKKDTVVEYTSGQEKIYGFVIPVFDSHGKYVGAVLLGLPVDSVTKRVTMLSNFTALTALFLFIIAMCLIAFALSWWVTKPLLKLHNATRAILHKGTETAHMVDINSNDEIGRLAASFNMMTLQLKKTTVSKAYVDNVISSMTDALIVISPDNSIQTVNEAATALLGASRDELIGQPVNILFPSFDEMPFKGKWMENLIELGEYRNYETTFKTQGGLHIPILLCCSVVKTAEMKVKYIVCTARDITDLKRAEETMFYQANYDMLTGLANRYYMEKQLEQAALGIKCSDHRHTFLYLDLDQFKIVNDMCGHHAGDQLLKHLSLMMKQKMRPEDLIARLGGDEFGLLLRNTNISDGLNISDKLCKEIQSFRFAWQDKLFNIGVSIGVVELNQQNTDVEWLLSAADRACYVSKEKGGNRVQLFHCDDRELSERHGEMRWISSITKAFQENRFYLNYQPIIPVGSNKNRDWYEVLIRMIDEKGNTVLPGAFLPAAQRYNMMPAIDRWVIHHFFSTYKYNAGMSLGGSSPLFNINISGASLNNGTFLGFVCEELNKYGVPPEVLCFEITETSVVSNFADANQFIQKLRSLGCSFALDDFGSGLSSFGYLKYLPVDFLKIDGSFIKNIASNQVDYAMVSSINEVAHLMGMQTVAEYVENKEIFECLKTIGVDFAQGYWVGKPGTLNQSKFNKLSQRFLKISS